MKKERPPFFAFGEKVILKVVKLWQRFFYVRFPSFSWRLKVDVEIAFLRVFCSLKIFFLCLLLCTVSFFSSPSSFIFKNGINFSGKNSFFRSSLPHCPQSFAKKNEKIFTHAYLPSV